MQSKMSFEFAGHVLDLRQGRLRKGGVDVALRRKSLLLLTYLVQNSGRVLAKDELIAAVWPDVIVSDDSLAQCMKDIRKLLGAVAGGFIRTVPRRGYIVDEAQVRSLGHEPVASAMSNASPFPDKPSIAVLPFQNISGDPEQDNFADGMVEEIIMALSRISALWVIARTSTFTYKGMPTDVKRVANELGVRYVMEGSVRRAGDRLRVTAQLIDATTGRHLWAERYDRPLSDVFDIQDEITRSVAASTETRVILAEREAAELRSPADSTARDLIARANGWRYDLSPEGLAETTRLVEEAIRLDPSNPVAHRLRARLFLSHMYSGDLETNEANVARALELARTALRLAPGDEYAHWVMAGAYAQAGRIEDAVAECELGLEINPNCSTILQRLGTCLAGLGRAEEAIKACQLAIQLDPRSPQNFWRHSHIALAHFVAGDYEAALQGSKNVVRSQPHLQSAIIWAAAAAALGKAEEAQTAVESCLAQKPDLRIDRVLGILLFARDQDNERLLALLRKAGLPE
jgi:adenylate cyclase